VDSLAVSNLTRSSFQYDDYWLLVHDFDNKFINVWFTLDMLQFYQCWISRSIGSYPNNLFLVPLDCYQANFEDVFEDYFSGTEPVGKSAFVKRMWRYVHPTSYLRHTINMRKKKTGTSGPPPDDSPAAPWDFDILKRKIICFSAKNINHYGMFAALNAGTLIHGDKTNKQECGLASFNSMGSRESPLPRTAQFVEYVYFLLNICHAIHSWVLKQDEADTESVDAPDFLSIFNKCRAATKSRIGGVLQCWQYASGKYSICQAPEGWI
jgi:hypothetical protein